MRIAIFGANSHIGSDLILSFARKTSDSLILFSRNKEALANWLKKNQIPTHYVATDYSEFYAKAPYDAIINCIGIVDPKAASSLGEAMVDLTLQYDAMIMDYLRVNSKTQYIFLSSGAVYGDVFDKPADEFTLLQVPTNWYGLAKQRAELRHREHPEWLITDLRIFSYFSSRVSLAAGFFMSQLLTCLRDNAIFYTSTDNIWRDYLHPADLYQLIQCILANSSVNQSLDCYSKACIDKLTLLNAMQHQFGLRYAFLKTSSESSQSNLKTNYYSLNKQANEYGYQPRYASLDCLMDESKLIMDRSMEGIS